MPHGGKRLQQNELEMADNAQTWHQDKPIYRQLMEQIVARILDHTYREGEMLPSVRQLASDFVVNPLTAARAYRELEEYTETRRGIGLVVKEGVRDLLLKREQRRFLREDWPALRNRIKALELDPAELLKGVRDR
jgi:GntR family transcriptional regulator